MTRERRQVRDLRGLKAIARGKQGEQLEARSLSRAGIVITPDEWPYDIPRKKKGKRKLVASQRIHPHYLSEEEEGEEQTQEKKHSHKTSPLVAIGIGMSGCLLLLMCWYGLLLPLWEGLQTQWHYGDSHVTHYEIHGHHLIAEVYNGNVTVFDTLQGQPERSKVYVLQTATDNTIVTFATRDANNDGKLDMSVGTQGNAIATTLYYSPKDDTFSKLPPEEDKEP